MVIVRHLATSSAVGLFAAKVRFTYRKCKNIVKKVANGVDMYAKRYTASDITFFISVRCAG